MLREYPDELEADFQEYYSLNLELMGEAYSIKHAAVCAYQLPPKSRTRTAINPEEQWDWQEHFLAEAVDSLHALIWQNSGGKGSKPAQIPRPKKEDDELLCISVDDYEEQLKRPRKEVTHGN